MAKKENIKGTVDNSFEGFDLLDQNPESFITEVKDDELSAEEIAALENTNKDSVENKGEDSDKNDSNKSESKAKIDDETSEEKKASTGKENDVDNKTDNSYSEWAKYMSDKGILHVNDDDVIESEDDLERIQNQTITNKINAWKEGIPEDGQKFLEFLENGGRPSDFHKYYYGDSSFEGFDISSEEDQKYVTKEALKLEGYSDEEIEDEINDAIDLGKLDKKSQIHLKKLQKIEKEQKELLVQSQKDYAKQEEDRRNKEWSDFKDGLYKTDVIGGFKLTPKVKDNLWEYMTKSDKKTGKTPYQTDAEANGDARYMAAFLQMNKWDIKSLERMVETKKVGELKGKLSNFTDSRNKMKSPSSGTIKDNTDPFAGFDKLQ